MGLDLFFFQSRVQTKIAERSRAGTTLIATCITKGFAKCDGVDTGVSREYRGKIDREKGSFFNGICPNSVFELVSLCSLIPLCLFQLTGHIQRQTLAPQFSEWVVRCVVERQTEKKTAGKKKSMKLKQRAWRTFCYFRLPSLFTDNVL